MVVCKLCQKAFKSRKALQQHRVTHFSRRRAPCPPVGGAVRSAPKPPRAPRTSNQSARVVSGRDLVAVLTMSTSNKIGDILYSAPINPASFTETRLAQEAALFARWKPKKMLFDIQSSAGGLVMGSYAAGWTSDSSVSFVRGDGALRQVAALVPYSAGHVGKRLRLDVPCNLVQKELYVSSKEVDDSVHGRVVMCVVAPVGAMTTSSTITVSVYLNWSVQFYGPRLPAASENIGIYADSDYAGYHTTSTNEWANGTKLSLKLHPGGALVPFPEARPQTVYKLDASANLTYKIKDKEDGHVRYGVLIPNFSVKGFAVFEDKNKASKFALSGDSSYCLDYSAAGDPVNPDNPVWYEEVGLSSLMAAPPGLSEALEEIERLKEELARLKLSPAGSFLEIDALDLP